jgi:ubiquinone/menaquinone biosynthesis C-methylase UbiE
MAAAEHELKSQEMKYFDGYYHKADMARQLLGGALVTYFQAEFDRAGQLYGQPLNRPATALDLGAGWGALSIWAADRYPLWRLVSMDYVEYSLVLQKDMAKLMALPLRDHPLVADWDTLPHASHTFDYVIADRALHHALDPVRMLREIHRVTKPGGVMIVLREPTLPARRPEARRVFATQMIEDGTNDHIWTTAQWGDFFRQAGWTFNPRVQEEDVTDFFNGGTNSLMRRGRKWLKHRVPRNWVERFMYPFVVQWGSTPLLSKLTFYAQASKS